MSDNGICAFGDLYVPFKNGDGVSAEHTHLGASYHYIYRCLPMARNIPDYCFYNANGAFKRFRRVVDSIPVYMVAALGGYPYSA